MQEGQLHLALFGNTKEEEEEGATEPLRPVQFLSNSVQVGLDGWICQLINCRERILKGYTLDFNVKK